MGTPVLWTLTVLLILSLLGLDVLLTRRPHAPSTREAVAWSAFYLTLPMLFCVFVWLYAGSDRGAEFLAGYLVEKSLSVDNLFIFMLLLAGFAVPGILQQRALLYGIIGALALRVMFIAVGAAALGAFDLTFLIFGAILVITALKVFRDARRGHVDVAVDRLRSVRLLRRFFAVTDDYRGTRLSVREEGRRALTPLAVVTAAMLGTDVVFAIDSVPAVYGITGDPYLVFATNAFALLGLRALYFLLAGALKRLVHLGYGLAAILAVIGAKLVLHWAHGRWASVPEIPTFASLAAVAVILAVVTATSLIASAGRGPAGSVADGEADSRVAVGENGMGLSAPTRTRP